MDREMCKLVRKLKGEQSRQAKVFVQPSMCETIGNNHICLRNASFPIRFYEIEVIATDMAGNVGTGSRKVLIAEENKLRVDRDNVGTYRVAGEDITSLGNPELVLVRELEHQEDLYLIDSMQVVTTPNQ